MGWQDGSVVRVLPTKPAAEVDPRTMCDRTDGKVGAVSHGCTWWAEDISWELI